MFKADLVTFWLSHLGSPYFVVALFKPQALATRSGACWFRMCVIFPVGFKGKLSLLEMCDVSPAFLGPPARLGAFLTPCLVGRVPLLA